MKILNTKACYILLQWILRLQRNVSFHSPICHYLYITQYLEYHLTDVSFRNLLRCTRLKILIKELLINT